MTEEPTFTRHMDIYRDLSDPNCPYCSEPRKGVRLLEDTWIDCVCLKTRGVAHP